MADFTLRNSFMTAANKMEISEIFVNNVFTGFIVIQGTGKTTVQAGWSYKEQKAVSLTMPKPHYSNILSDKNFLKDFESAFLFYLFGAAA